MQHLVYRKEKKKGGGEVSSIPNNIIHQRTRENPVSAYKVKLHIS